MGEVLDLKKAVGNNPYKLFTVLYMYVQVSIAVTHSINSSIGVATGGAGGAFAPPHFEVGGQEYPFAPPLFGMPKKSIRYTP